MTRRRAIALGALAVLLLGLALALRWGSRPDRVAELILDQVGNALGLDISASGSSEYRLRGTPRLVVRDLVAREPGAATPLLRADRVYLSLPWSTIRARGADLTVQRVELDAPQLDLAALARWRAGRPPSAEVKVPTLTDGFAITRGRVVAEGWSIEGIRVSAPVLHPDERVAARASGRLRNDAIRVPFDLHVVLSRPAMNAALGVAGFVSAITSDWRMPMQLKLSGRLAEDASGLGLDSFKLGAHARYVVGDSQSSFVHGLAGSLRYLDGALRINPLGVAVRGRERIPTLDAAGKFAWSGDIGLALAGTLPRWPEAWPALPPPIGQSNSPLPFKLDYRGAPSLAGATTLQLRRDATRFDARLRLPAVLEWIDASASGSPLPPIDGTLTTPKLEIAGATLEGVEIEFDDTDAEP